MAIKLDLERKGIPVSFGEVDLLFPTDDDSVQRLYSFGDRTDERLIEMERKQQQLKGLKDDDLSFEEAQEIISLSKEIACYLLDGLFGAGNFAKVYAVYPDILGIMKALSDLIEQLPAEIQKQNEKAHKKQAQLIEKYKKKKK